MKIENSLSNKLQQAQLNLINSNNNALATLTNNLHAQLSNSAEKSNTAITNLVKEFANLNLELKTAFGQFQTEILKQEKESNQQNSNTLNELNTTLLNKFNNFTNELKTSLNNDVTKLIETLRLELDKLNAKVEDRLKEGFENTSKTFNSILERLTKIDEAQKKIDQLSTEIVSLQDVLTDKKTRGIFGEVQLNQILTSAFGENNHQLYQTQYKLSTGVMADSIIFTPEPLGNIVIDAKFPLENYQRMVDNTTSTEVREQARKDFETNLKKHIDDIASKYIIKNETADQAILFLPAEAIFAWLHAYHSNIITYAQKKRIWIASPTTLMAQLTTLQVVLKNLEQTKHTRVIQEHLGLLAKDFERYKIRWNTLSKDIEKVTKDVQEIHITSNKIGDRFEKIHSVELPIIENE